MRLLPAALLVAVVSIAAAHAQVVPYGTPTPAGFLGQFHSGGQVPYIGNPGFNVQIAGVPNLLGAVLGVSTAPASIPSGSLVLLIDPATWTLINLPAPVTFIPVPLPLVPGFVGSTAFGQVALADPGIPGGIGLTNAISLTIMPDRTPTRAFFGGQDFSQGANAPGQLSVLDLTTVPPTFRATGSLGFSGNIASNFSPKIVVAELVRIAYALGCETTNQFVRIIDVSADPMGLVTWPMLGDIPLAQGIPSTVGQRDMEVLEDNTLLFVTSGGSGSSNAVVLDVFDVSTVPSTIPSVPIQSLSYAGAGGETGNLALSHDGSRLALLLGNNSSPTLTLFNINVGAPQPLSQAGTFTFLNTSTFGVPNDVQFSPDGTLLFVVGGDGYFSVVDVSRAPAMTVINGATWTAPSSNWFQGAAVGIFNGAMVGLMGESSTTGGANYIGIDLNTTSSNFGMAAFAPFTTNPSGNISSHRGHARQNIVIMTDGTGATIDCQFVDIIDLSQPTATGFVSWRVQMPSTSSLTPGGLSCIPRDFDMF